MRIPIPTFKRPIRLKEDTHHVWVEHAIDLAHGPSLPFAPARLARTELYKVWWHVKGAQDPILIGVHMKAAHAFSKMSAAISLLKKQPYIKDRLTLFHALGLYQLTEEKP